jgi:hypothetical protein
VEDATSSGGGLGLRGTMLEKVGGLTLADSGPICGVQWSESLGRNAGRILPTGSVRKQNTTAVAISRTFFVVKNKDHEPEPAETTN